ncbi:RsbT co-antagonist protein RsbRA [Aureibacillus halotolerans]|uniref:RsbT co-antagonist protein RsbR n=1 Tax=Aureibacillus halotolerans TaxID=1508390 RepID=A0A4R6TVM1_9BACI|nr:RsbT co-antagonist protein RsbRA [Aureibacillus halotolerans]TDQ36722.1 rsbT co-antagonist protein RsbR [Aureibacillus halotolerans]
MKAYIVEAIEEQKDVIAEKWLNELETVRSSWQVQKMSDDLYKTTNREFLETIYSNIEHTQAKLVEELKHFSDRIIRMGWSLNYMTEGLQAFRRTVLDTLFHMDTTNQFEIMDQIQNWIDPIINEIVRNYSGSWEATVSLQKIALQELSAPLIPVFENITIMPLIGTIDTERAKLIMENLLEGVIKHRSAVVLIDITGVPVVDTMVAHHIIQAADAVRLIGAKCILVGIRPEIAQTIVTLGIDLSQFPTKSTLRKGIESALHSTNRKLVSVDEEVGGEL